MSANIKSYAPMVDHALKMENDCDDSLLRKEGKTKSMSLGKFGKKPQQFSRRNTKGKPCPPNLRIRKSLPGNMGIDQWLICAYCGRSNHTTVKCYQKKNVCLKCLKPDYWVKDFPMMKVEDYLKTQGRVFTLTEQEAKVSTSMIRGMLSICDVDAKVLIDLGSSHSFVAPHFAHYMNVAPACLNDTLVVCTHVGGSIETDRAYMHCKLTIDRCDLPVDLIHLDIQDFDVILDMDLLFTHHAIVNYHGKTVTFKCPDQAEIHFSGIKDSPPLHLISTFRASSLLAKKCEGYLAYVVENRVFRPYWKGYQ
ncbi:uncharacterized protein LOC105420904 [Amborella trichopoda]|uniref:uncharacterized protein LOC105420904 n=1 Tax=Amborella trichopoda TaxID=13333 RepID=UPI0005D3ED9F|nr:uncharacterized protein LOC105420904 [Amborella trichopoda]|eukprot:XP_011624547.1 uncharacterized protein LOC105420904 [Amborella trichopoda]